MLFFIKVYSLFVLTEFLGMVLNGMGKIRQSPSVLKTFKNLYFYINYLRISYNSIPPTSTLTF